MISYNELYDILRKEKYSEALQPLSKVFIEEVSEYLNDKKVESNKEDDLFSDNIAKSKKQLENSISIFKELMRLRKKKLLNLVFVATETGMMKRDYENMLSVERELFDKLVKTFEEGDKQIAKLRAGNKDKENKNRMIMFNQNVEQFVGMDGNVLGPFAAGELVNLDVDIAKIFVDGGKAGYIDSE